MTEQQKGKILSNLKPNQVLVDIEYKEIGVDNDGFPLFEINYINPPLNYGLEKLIEAHKVAILVNLNHAPEPINS